MFRAKEFSQAPPGIEIETPIQVSPAHSQDLEEAKRAAAQALETASEIVFGEAARYRSLCDLHLHSNCSDGTFTPADLVINIADFHILTRLF